VSVERVRRREREKSSRVERPNIRDKVKAGENFGLGQNERKRKKTEIEETAKKWTKRKEDWQTEKKKERERD
jgi:hypothetical protein